MDNVCLPTSSISNYGLDYLTKVDNFSKCLTVPISQILTIDKLEKHIEMNMMWTNHKNGQYVPSNKFYP